MKVLVLGATGILGSNLSKTLSLSKEIDVFGSTRDISRSKYFANYPECKLVTLEDAMNLDLIESLFLEINPDVVINSLSLSPDLLKKKDSRLHREFYSELPHKIAEYCSGASSRYIHISTDGVFSGRKGNYTELDLPDPITLEADCKLKGEVVNGDAISIRTSFFGNSLLGDNGLLDWFLIQKDKCKGYSNYIFSGLPVITLSEIIRDIVIPNKELKGLYNIGHSGISKYDLLCLLADRYKKTIRIEREVSIKINRTLDSTKFIDKTGYDMPDLQEMIESMHSFQQ
jgi:dTDP-4-dehydrorhamnose reductase